MVSKTSTYEEIQKRNLTLKVETWFGQIKFPFCAGYFIKNEAMKYKNAASVYKIAATVYKNSAVDTNNNNASVESKIAHKYIVCVRYIIYICII
jgi:hypothetical protein